MYNANKENQELVNGIRDELREIVNGYLKEIDGEPVEAQQDAEGYYFIESEGEIYTENPDADENAHELDELDEYTINTYLNNKYLDVEYITDAQKNYKACRVMIAAGGPTIYLNTWTGKVELYWWNEYAEAYLDREVIDEIDATFEEGFKYW